jgi:hypothetical protein
LDRFRTQKNSGIHSPRTCWCSWFDTGTRCHTYTSTAWLPTACMTWSACRKLDHACQQHTQHNTDNQQPQPPDCHTKKRSSDTRRRGATQTDTCVHVRRQRTCRHTLCVQPYVCMHHRQQSAQRLALARADRYCHYCVTMITQLVCIGTAMRRHAQCRAEQSIDQHCTHRTQQADGTPRPTCVCVFNVLAISSISCLYAMPLLQPQGAATGRIAHAQPRALAHSRTRSHGDGAQAA